MSRLADPLPRCRQMGGWSAAHLELPSGARPKARGWTDQAVTEWRRTGQRPSPVMVWTPAQAGRFLDHPEHHDIYLYPMFVLILHRRVTTGGSGPSWPGPGQGW